jgi:hypothetical protein
VDKLQRLFDPAQNRHDPDDEDRKTMDEFRCAAMRREIHDMRFAVIQLTALIDALTRQP